MKPNLSINESPRKYSSLRNVPNKLLSDNEWVIIQLRKDMKEPAADNKSTSDFLTGSKEQHEGTSRILRDS